MDVRKGDTVLVLAGKDAGKRGTVDRVEKTKRGFGVVIPGINMAKRHQRARSRTQSGGIIDIPVPHPRQQRAGRLPALQPADARRPRPARGRARPQHARLQALRRADRGDARSERRRDEADPKPERAASTTAKAAPPKQPSQGCQPSAAAKPARDAQPDGRARGSRRPRPGSPQPPTGRVATRRPK